MTIKERILDIYSKQLVHGGAEDDVAELVSSLSPDDTLDNVFDLYMFLSWCESWLDEATLSVVHDLKQSLLYIAVLQDGQPTVVYSPRDTITSGMFVDNPDSLNADVFVITNHWQNDDKLYFSERITTDSRGLKYREIILPEEGIPQHMMENDLLVERFEIMERLDLVAELS